MTSAIGYLHRAVREELLFVMKAFFSPISGPARIVRDLFRRRAATPEPDLHYELPEPGAHLGVSEASREPLFRDTPPGNPE